MSKGGGAGKVYFVLYLAVVLELLIIIVERDEAEEGLLRKQKETMRIVESILSQLQSGAGTEGINTRPQDEITVLEEIHQKALGEGIEIRSSRRYIVEVGVTDVTSALKRLEGENEKEYVQRLKKLIKLGNVEDIEYQIFYHPSDDPLNAPGFPSETDLEKNKTDFTKFAPGMTIPAGEDAADWEFMGLRKLNLDEEETFNNIDLANVSLKSLQPVYPKEDVLVVGDNYSPKDIPEDSIFYYSMKQSLEKVSSQGKTELQKRSFTVNFQPPAKAGWYKLRFSSRTNRILGVRSDENYMLMDDETTVNIGTVQLTVKDLRKVQKQLVSALEKYKLPDFDSFIKDKNIEKFDAELEVAIEDAADDEDGIEMAGKIKLYGYIAKLLNPGMSSNFDQNKGSIEFNIRVITPKPPVAEPTVTLPNYTGGFDKVAPVFEFVTSPYQSETANAVEGRIVDNNGATVARIDCRPLDRIAGLEGVTPPTTGGRREYRGYVDKELAPGKYKIEVTHKLSGRSKTEEAQLEIFKTGLTEDSEKRIRQRLQGLAFYGYPVSIDAEPNSGGKIKSNQFRLYLWTDNNNQPVPIEGVSNSQNPIKALPCEAKEVKLRVTWVQPYTSNEVDLLPLQSFSLKQEEPEIIMQPQPEISGTAMKLKINVTGIKIEKPTSGCGEPATVDYRVGAVEIVDGLKTYQAPIEPTIEEDGSGGLFVYFELEGKLPPGERKVKGTVQIPIFATATNPNGKVSEESTAYLTVRLNHEPGSDNRRRNRR